MAQRPSGRPGEYRTLKITYEKAEEIRAYRRDHPHLTQTQIALHFGVPHSIAHRVLKDQIWLYPRDRRVEGRCAVCGKPHVYYACRPHKTCSPHCSLEYKRSLGLYREFPEGFFVCQREGCGKPIPLGTNGRRSSSRFCSPQCGHLNRTGKKRKDVVKETKEWLRKIENEKNAIKKKKANEAGRVQKKALAASAGASP